MPEEERVLKQRNKKHPGANCNHVYTTIKSCNCNHVYTAVNPREFRDLLLSKHADDCPIRKL